MREIFDIVVVMQRGVLVERRGDAFARAAFRLVEASLVQQARDSDAVARHIDLMAAHITPARLAAEPKFHRGE